MMSPAFIKYPSVVPLARSPALLLAIGLVHFMPAASVWGAAVPARVSGLVIVLCVLSAVREISLTRRLREISLRPHAEGAQLVSAGQISEGRVLRSSVDMGALVVLHWRAETDGSVQRFALLRDAFSAEDWRKLKVWLRWAVLRQPA
jgi:hypothetical protein